MKTVKIIFSLILLSATLSAANAESSGNHPQAYWKSSSNRQTQSSAVPRPT